MLAHAKELVDQNAGQAARFLSPLLVGVNSAGLKRRDLDHPVIIAGIGITFRCRQGHLFVLRLRSIYESTTTETLVLPFPFTALDTDGR